MLFLLFVTLLIQNCLAVEVKTSGDPNFPKDLSDKLIETCKTVYPKIVAYFNNLNAPNEITLNFNGSYDGVAFAAGPQITFSTKYMVEHPKDVDVVTHESTHIIQGYPSYDPSWLVEGIADFSRFKFGVDNAGAGWKLPEFDSKMKYTDSYTTTARFLVWLDKNYNGIVRKLNSAMKDGSFKNDETWKNLTGGKSVDDLWNDYSNNPSI
uniref:Secretory protein n=1 Tax=Panagrolaimus sp. ES5 TaxID=591445 RepID=A0AC34GC52_9BILA